MIFLDRSLVYQLHVNGFTFSFIILSSKFKRIKLKISKSLVSCAADLFLLLPSKKANPASSLKFENLQPVEGIPGFFSPPA